MDTLFRPAILPWNGRGLPCHQAVCVHECVCLISFHTTMTQHFEIISDKFTADTSVLKPSSLSLSLTECSIILVVSVSLGNLKFEFSPEGRLWRITFSLLFLNYSREMLSWVVITSWTSPPINSWIFHSHSLIWHYTIHEFCKILLTGNERKTRHKYQPKRAIVSMFCSFLSRKWQVNTSN
jgi:hypothetical protein